MTWFANRSSITFLRHYKQRTICGAGDSNIQLSNPAFPPIQEAETEKKRSERLKQTLNRPPQFMPLQPRTFDRNTKHPPHLLHPHPLRSHLC